MKRYQNKSIEGLARELAAGLTRLRKDYIDAAEGFLEIIDPKQEYPYDLVVFRLTGFSPRGKSDAKELISGASLQKDLQQLMLDLCDSFKLKTSHYSGKIYDTGVLAKVFNVSTKTIQRWRQMGLAARRLVFPDGKRRIAFIDSSVRRFVSQRKLQVQRSTGFSKLKEADRKDIIRRARRMSEFCQCSFSEVVKHLAARTGRASETIRYTIRKYDKDNPEDAVFAHGAKTFGDQKKIMIYRSYIRGISAQTLARQYHRTPGSIFRLVSEIRTNQLLDRKISYIHNDEFDAPKADKNIFGGKTSTSPSGRARKKTIKVPLELPPYLKSLYEIPLLNAENERDLFRKYNYLKFAAAKIRSKINMDAILSSQVKQAEAMLIRANVIKNQIIRCNLRLVVSIAKKHVGGVQGLFELISDGNVSLMKAVEKFDYSKGFRFSTYASYAIIRNYARSVPKERHRLDRFATGQDEALDIAASLRSYDPNELNIFELRESIDSLLSQLTPTERSVLIGHYGLKAEGRVKTLDQLGQTLGVSKEKVRQIEIKAIKKLRTIMSPQDADLLT